jgi:acetylornithine/succinyldiaminopimelate/putrescine aminotransferase
VRAALSGINLGHCHPKVVKAIQDQAAKLWYVSWYYYNVPQTELAEKLAEICPKGLRRCPLSSCRAVQDFNSRRQLSVALATCCGIGAFRH